MRNPSGRSPAGCTLIGILAMLAAPADAVRCVTPTCQCEALKAVYSDLQISDIHTGFPGTEADCCKLSDVRCNDAGGITDLKFSPDDKQLVSVGEDGIILVWNIYG